MRSVDLIICGAGRGPEATAEATESRGELIELDTATTAAHHQSISGDSAPGAGSMSEAEKVVKAGGDSKVIKSELLEYMEGVEEEEEEVFANGQDVDELLNSEEGGPQDTQGPGSQAHSASGGGPARVLSLGTAYGTVRAARRAASCWRQLNPAPARVESVSTGTFTSEGDERILHANVEHNLRLRVSRTLSFDPLSGKCNTCLGGGHAALSAVGGGPIVLVTTDQSFPPVLPAKSDTGKECVRICRTEDGSLQEAIHTLADAIGRHKLTPGSIILLGSMAHLSAVGTAQYTTDWVRSRWWIRERFGEHILVLPLTPVLLGGAKGHSTVRSIIETLSWFNSLNATETVLMKGINSMVLGTQFSGARGRCWANDRQCLRVPAGIDSKATITMVSEGWGSRPDAVPPLSPAAELEIIHSLLRNLEDAFTLNLDCNPLMDRCLSSIREKAKLKKLCVACAVVGGSHARRLADAIEETGAVSTVHRLCVPGWRVTRTNVDKVVRELGTLSPRPDRVIFQGLDNSVYYCLGEDGTLSLPRKDNTDGSYHIEGELRVASKEQVLALMRLAHPILTAVEGADTTLVTCLPRWSHPDNPCCDKEGHVVGRGEALQSKVLSDLVSVKKEVRSYIFKERIKKCFVMDPMPFWEAGPDPVHVALEAYRKIARTIVCNETEEAEERGGDVSVAKRVRVVSCAEGRAPERRDGGAARGRGRGWGGGRGRGRRGSW